MSCEGSQRLVRRRALLLLGMTLTPVSAVAAPGLACALTATERTKLAAWLTRVTAGSIKIAKVRKAAASDEQQVCKVELMFAGEESKFGPFLVELKQRLGWSFPERVLLKLATALRVSPASVGVDIIVGETAYSTYVKSGGGLVVLEPSVLKHETAHAVVHLDSAPGSTTAVELPTDQTVNAVAARVRDIVVRRLKSRHGAVRIQPSPLNFGSFTLQADALKGEVLPDGRWWELIEIAFFVSALGPKSFGIGCVVDGRYGAGAGKQPPSDYDDMEPTYSKELLTFVKGLLATVQQEMKQ